MKIPRLFLLGAFLLSLVGTYAYADVDTEAFDEYKQAHPRAKFYGSQFYESEDFFEDVGTANMIYGTCLLYTSPSPRDATLSRMPSSA